MFFTLSRMFASLRAQGIPSLEETETPEVPPETILQKIAAVLF
jgi:hypothetical protein